MARGWESKSVEEQMANALGNPSSNPNSGLTQDEQRRIAEQRHAAQARQRESLNLQRENILSQRTSHPARRAALEAALASIEEQLQALG
jgi:hypothetical protein